MNFIEKICDDNEILLIFDEVQTGIGIKENVGFQHFTVNRILSFWKAQVCGVLANKKRKFDEIQTTFSEKVQESTLHSEETLSICFVFNW
jgi:hypothetical protein